MIIKCFLNWPLFLFQISTIEAKIFSWKNCLYLSGQSQTIIKCLKHWPLDFILFQISTLRHYSEPVNADLLSTFRHRLGSDRSRQEVVLTYQGKCLFIGLALRADLIKHFTIVIYDSRVVLTIKLPILRL